MAALSSCKMVLDQNPVHHMQYLSMKEKADQNDVFLLEHRLMTTEIPEHQIIIVSVLEALS